MAAAVFLSLCSWKMLKQPLSHLLLTPEVIALTPTEESSVPCQSESVKALYKHLYWILTLLQAREHLPEPLSAQKCIVIPHLTHGIYKIHSGVWCSLKALVEREEPDEQMERAGKFQSRET